jgi:hypothetical protein
VAQAYNPTLESWRQEDQMFEVSLGYETIPCLIKQAKKKNSFFSLGCW